MNCIEFLGMYWSESLETELEIRYTFVDYDPSVGVGIEFEWEALDENGKDVRDDLTSEEQAEIENMIEQAIAEPNDPY
jgi:hypothetical protein